jgi:hypothetical protein
VKRVFLVVFLFEDKKTAGKTCGRAGINPGENKNRRAKRTCG